MSRVARLVWWATPLAALVLLRTADRPPMSPGALHDPLADPAGTVMALVRSAAEVGAWYLVVVSTLHALVAVRVLPDRVARAVTVPALRGLLGVSVGLVAATDHAPVADPAPIEASDATATMRPAPAGSATMAPERAATVPPRLDTTWTVERGESFWSIAGDVLADRSSRPPSATEHDRYWRRLVQVNRSRLVDPGDPDLLLPGQVLELPR